MQPLFVSLVAAGPPPTGFRPAKSAVSCGAGTPDNVVPLPGASLRRMAGPRTVVTAVHLRVVLRCRTDRITTVAEEAEGKLVRFNGHIRAPLDVHLVIAVRLSLPVDVIPIHSVLLHRRHRHCGEVAPTTFTARHNPDDLIRRQEGSVRTEAGPDLLLPGWSASALCDELALR
jgi:hypothetical protein